MPWRSLPAAGSSIWAVASAVRRHGSASATVVAEPMAGASRGARQLFALAAVAAKDRLPFPSGAFHAAWVLATLSTIDEPLLSLAELHRVLAPRAQVGLYEYLATTDRPFAAPAGNRFFAAGSLHRMLGEAGFEVVDEIDADQLRPSPRSWQDRVDQTKDELEQRHRGEPAFEDSRHEEECFKALIDDGLLRVRLLHAVRS